MEIARGMTAIPAVCGARWRWPLPCLWAFPRCRRSLAGPAQGPPSKPAAGPPTPKATPVPKAAPGAPATAPRRRRLAARLRDAERRADHRLPAPGRELGPAEHMVAYAAVSYEAKGATKPALGSVKIEADTKVAVVRAAGQLQRPQDHGVQLPHAAQGPGAGGRGGDREGDPGRRAGDRPRPRAGQRRPQPDHPQERRGREGGPADDLLQQEARRAGQPRRRRRSGARSRRTTSSSPSTRTGTCSSTSRRRSTTCATSRAGSRPRT